VFAILTIVTVILLFFLSTVIWPTKDEARKSKVSGLQAKILGTAGPASEARGRTGGELRASYYSERTQVSESGHGTELELLVILTAREGK
jgi:hypothetical protein